MNYLKYLPLALFTAAVGKGLVLGFGLVDAPILLILGSMAAFYEFKVNDVKIKVMQARCDTVDKHLTTLYKEVESLKSYNTGIKVGNQMRSTTGLK